MSAIKCFSAYSGDKGSFYGRVLLRPYCPPYLFITHRMGIQAKFKTPTAKAAKARENERVSEEKRAQEHANAGVSSLTLSFSPAHSRPRALFLLFFWIVYLALFHSLHVCFKKRPPVTLPPMSPPLSIWVVVVRCGRIRVKTGYWGEDVAYGLEGSKPALRHEYVAELNVSALV